MSGDAPGLDIVELADCMEVAPLLARWHAAEWSELYDGWDEATALAEFHAMTEPGRVPTTWVAFETGRRDAEGVLGSVSLIADDELPGFEHFGPWLASLYVRPSARGGGLGRALTARCSAEAARLGFERLYLFTSDQAQWYAFQGWRTVAAADANGHSATVMRYELDHLAPRRARISRWLSDPWIGGAYSYLRVGGTPDDRRRLAGHVLDGLHLAGEATSAEYPGTAHGAWFSGERAADAALGAGARTVAVVGAGLAGLAAARRATAAGATVTVFEAAFEPGGRIRVDRELGAAVPLGATWAHGTRGNPFHDAAVEAGARPRTGTFDHPTTYVAGLGRLDPDAEARVAAALARVEQALASAAAAGADRSVGSVLADLLESEPEGAELYALRARLRGEFENLYAAPVDELSLQNRSEPFRTDGDDVMLVGDLGLVAERLAAGLDIRLEEAVTSLSQRPGGWCVRTHLGAETSADAVILTVPLPVLQHGRITMEPVLPDDVLDSISRIGVGPVAKAFFTFDEAWWAPEPSFWCTAATPLPFELWVDVSGFTGRPTLCAFAVGDDARAAEWMDEHELCDVAHRMLRTAVGGAST